MSTNSFDERAATWDDDPAKVERAEAVARAIREAIPLDQSMRMLEYGAGTGLVTEALHESVGPVTLADTSKGMREVIQDKIEAGAITNARVWDLDLATQPAPDERFDLVVTMMTLHHITNVHIVLSGFAELLEDGGQLCVVDLDEEDGSFHGVEFEGHHGFERSRLSSDLASAGFTEIAFRNCHDVVRGGVRYPLFLATCMRGGSARGQRSTLARPSTVIEAGSTATIELWEIEARDAIRDLVVRYNSNGDAGRFGEVMELFAPDAVMVLDDHVRTGRDEILTIFTGVRERLTVTDATGSKAPTYVRHMTATHQIDLIDRHSARGRCYYQVLTSVGLDHWGRYIDEYRTVDGRWRFTERRVTVDGRSPTSLFPIA